MWRTHGRRPAPIHAAGQASARPRRLAPQEPRTTRGSKGRTRGASPSRRVSWHQGLADPCVASELASHGALCDGHRNLRAARVWRTRCACCGGQAGTWPATWSKRGINDRRATEPGNCVGDARRAARPRLSAPRRHVASTAAMDAAITDLARAPVSAISAALPRSAHVRASTRTLRQRQRPPEGCPKRSQPNASGRTDTPPGAPRCTPPRIRPAVLPSPPCVHRVFGPCRARAGGAPEVATLTTAGNDSHCHLLPDGHGWRGLGRLLQAPAACAEVRGAPTPRAPPPSAAADLPATTGAHNCPQANATKTATADLIMPMWPEPQTQW